ncbi:ABC transporter ATP-binding protein [Mesomycoplasma lagogenitalium]|uniref:ABC transporter ATP-binding protein n=1 Tax=Mesomycoplasma lagogenitalium TaxID=171286 RepID=A0ABY8LW33_9BACT|nr:ABC transporter ATP-binding protein [Mesomycoplasma lagogenitalium]WGI37020.1 ABC transporter ATP-binding protein [Mesomycoplasma lagogenitalium]
MKNKHQDNFSQNCENENLNFDNDVNSQDSYQYDEFQYVVKKFPFRTKVITRRDLKGTSEMLRPKNNEEILVQMKNVDISYGSGFKKFRAVSDINLNIYKGEVLGLVGESGSGKSTIGKTLVGLVPYSFGEIKLLDKTLPKKLSRGLKMGNKLKEYKEIENFLVNKVQMIFQDPANSLNPHANVEKIVSEGLMNTKNSKEIYLLNFDQVVKNNLYDVLKQDLEKNASFFGQYEKELDEKIFTNENVAFNALYENLLEKLQENNLNELVLMLEKEKEQRLIENKLSEKDCRKLLVREILKSVGLDETVLSRYPLEFSGGQQQRIGISRAVVLRPQLLVADEPISALDVSIQAQVVNIFNDLKEKYNLTILFIAHDLRMVEYISDRIAVMNKGRILEVGKTEEIMKNSLHPYTRSLLGAVPSIKSKKGSLIGYVYNINMHKYSENNQPEWVKINDDHFVLGTNEEVKKWMKGNW